MTLEKLFEFVKTQFLKEEAHLRNYELSKLSNLETTIIKNICKIILTNYTLKDLNARH